MLELSRVECGGWNMGYGGDTLNTAVHLARSGHDVAYMTAMGTDPFSANLVDVEWKREGIDTSLVLRHPSRGAGLYAITTDPSGERSFTYWRDSSAAREMFALPGAAAALDTATQADLIAFSLISLAILPTDGRKKLFDLARKIRDRGGQVAFDGNYRTRLWTDASAARQARDEAIALATIGLPTLEDESALSGETYADEVVEHWQGLGCTETVVKLGAGGCRMPDGSIIRPGAVLEPVDTSGAGDAFNAGYLGARLPGADMPSSARAGHALAGWTIMRRGAIPARDS